MRFSELVRNTEAMHFTYLISEGAAWIKKTKQPGTDKTVSPKTGAALEPGNN